MLPLSEACSQPINSMILLTIFLKSWHTSRVDKLLVLSIVSRTDEKDIIGIDHYTVFQPLDDQEFILLRREYYIAAVIAEDLAVSIENISVLVLGLYARIEILPTVYVRPAEMDRENPRSVGLFHHSVVDRNLLYIGICTGYERFLRRTANSHFPTFERACNLWDIFLQFFLDNRGLPYENT